MQTIGDSDHIKEPERLGTLRGLVRASEKGLTSSLTCGLALCFRERDIIEKESEIDRDSESQFCESSTEAC